MLTRDKTLQDCRQAAAEDVAALLGDVGPAVAQMDALIAHACRLRDTPNPTRREWRELSAIVVALVACHATVKADLREIAERTTALVASYYLPAPAAMTRLKFDEDRARFARREGWGLAA